MFLNTDIRRIYTLANTEGAIKTDNPEKLATYGTQDEEKQNKNTTHYVLDTTLRKRTQITSKIHECCYKELEVKTNRTSFRLDNNLDCIIHFNIVSSGKVLDAFDLIHTFRLTAAYSM